MPYYFVSGTIYQYHMCDCVYCDQEDEIIVARKVEASSSEEASSLVLQYVKDDATYMCEWEDEPSIEELPTDQVMQLVGAPTLPGLEIDLNEAELAQVEG